MTDWGPYLVFARPSAREVPDLLIGTQKIVDFMRSTPSKKPRQGRLQLVPTSSLTDLIGTLGEELFGSPRFLSADAGLQMYWVSEEMCEVLRHAALELPTDVIAATSVTRPISHGFVVFETPILSWTAHEPDVGPVPMGGIAWAGFQSMRFDDRPRACLAIVPMTPQLQAPIRGLAPESSSYLFPHASLADHLEMGAAMLMDENSTTTDHLEGDENRRLLLALMMLLESSITEPADAQVDRATRRRAARASVPSDVRILVLRRATSESNQGPVGSVDWTRRWITSGHWRNQPCGPGQKDRRLTWISPYVKGPADKPLVVRPTVGALVR